jgi:pimeloyl-ACP methyl ester carboxylesterase
VDARPQVIQLPGAVLPADLAYGALLEALGDEVQAVAKELEIYAGDEPPLEYALAVEIEGILRAAEASGFDRFHLVGYSAGGASSLAFAARHPERLRSRALLEPAWAGNEGLDPAEEAVWREYDRIMALPPEEMMPAFVRSNLGTGVEPPPPPPGPPPPWMARRPAGIGALMRAFRAGGLDLDALRGFQAPVYFALGGLSNPDQPRRSPSASPPCFRTSRPRCSRSATTSTRRTEWSPSGSLHRFGAYGPGARPSRSPRSSRSVRKGRSVSCATARPATDDEGACGERVPAHLQLVLCEHMARRLTRACSDANATAHADY